MIRITVYTILFSFLTIGILYAIETNLGLTIDEQVNVETNYFDSITGRFDRDEAYNTLYVSPDMFLSINEDITAYLMGDVEWSHYFNDDDSDYTDFDAASAWVDVSKGAMSARLGIQAFQLGRGFITESNEPGATLSVSGPQKFYIDVNAAKLFDTSPVASLALGYKMGFFEEMEIFFAWFYDSDDSIAEMLNNQSPVATSLWLYNRNPNLWRLYQLGLLEFTSSSGNFFWYGANGDFFIGDMFVSGTAIIEYGYGSVALGHVSREADIDVFAYLLDVNLNYNVTEHISTGAFLFMTSGDSQPFQGDMNVFISPMPYNSKTSIFFNRVYNENERSDALSKAGISWAGVIAPGFKLSFNPFESFASEILAAVFFPEADIADNRNWYGWEADILFMYTLDNRYELFSEAAYFQHGDFYEIQGETPDPASKFSAGFRCFF